VELAGKNGLESTDKNWANVNGRAGFTYYLAFCPKKKVPPYFYLPEAKHSFGRIMEILYGAEKRCSRVRLAITSPKVNRFG